MEALHTDTIVPSIAPAADRRNALRALAGFGAAALALLGVGQHAEAKQKRHRAEHGHDTQKQNGATAEKSKPKKPKSIPGPTGPTGPTGPAGGGSGSSGPTGPTGAAGPPVAFSISSGATLPISVPTNSQASVVVDCVGGAAVSAGITFGNGVCNVIRSERSGSTGWVVAISCPFNNSTTGSVTPVCLR